MDQSVAPYPRHPNRRVILRLAGLGLTGALLTGSSGRARPGVETSGDAPADRHTAYARATGHAVSRVEALWGAGAVTVPVRLHLPAAAGAWAGVTGHRPDSDVPASTVTRSGQSTIVVHPDAWDRLTGAGRAAVLTHEVTHLAQGGSAGTPWWLGEGSAEFTAHRGSDTPPAQIAGPVWTRLRLDPPTLLPGPGTAGVDHWSGYAVAWSVLLSVAARHGAAAVPRLFRAVARSGAVDRGCQEALGESAAQVTGHWTTWWAAQT